MSSNRRLRKTTTALGLAAAIALNYGCAEPTTGMVTGLVTVDGAAAKSGSIAFFPINGQGSTAGAVITDGRYEAKVPFGVMKVEIRVPKIVGQEKLYDTPDSRVRSRMAEALPPRYNDATELQVEVKPGKIEQSFDLTTK